MKKYPCPCCGCYTYNVPAKEDCGYICPVCFWENDPFLLSDDDYSDRNGGLSLNEAKMNYLRLGASLERLVEYVREPTEEEKNQ